MEKIAFLILAHTDTKQLKRTVMSLDFEFFDIFIHIDRRKNIKDFRLDEIKLKRSKLFVVKNRKKVIWGDISIVNATLEMYYQAYSNTKYIRYVTLSGLDYPIMSNKELWKCLSQKNIEYIGGEPIKGKGYMRIDWPYFWKNKINFEISKHIIMFETPYKLALLLRKGRHKILKINNRKASIYFSPQWHALSGEFVEYMIKTLEKDRGILKYFKHTFAPDEMLIPTLLFNSEFAKRAIKSDYPKGTHYNDKVITHFINYEPQVEIFDERRYVDIISSGKMFMRKVSSTKSDKLLEMIDQYRVDN